MSLFWSQSQRAKHVHDLHLFCCSTLIEMIILFQRITKINYRIYFNSSQHICLFIRLVNRLELLNTYGIWITIFKCWLKERQCVSINLRLCAQWKTERSLELKPLSYWRGSSFNEVLECSIWYYFRLPVKDYVLSNMALVIKICRLNWIWSIKSEINGRRIYSSISCFAYIDLVLFRDGNIGFIICSTF